jgi:hypothetical protein
MGKLVGPDGREVTSKGKPVELPGLSMQDPVTSLDLLGSVARSCYIMAQQYAAMAGPKGERQVKLLSKDVSGIASQGATVAEFASNIMAELTFTLAEAEARIAVLKGLIPEDKLQEAEKADFGVATEWENRRSLFSSRVPLIIKLKQRIGLALSEAVVGSAPTQADFDKLKADAEKAGFTTEQPTAPAPGEEAVGSPEVVTSPVAKNSDGTQTDASPD